MQKLQHKLKPYRHMVCFKINTDNAPSSKYINNNRISSILAALFEPFLRKQKADHTIAEPIAKELNVE